TAAERAVQAVQGLPGFDECSHADALRQVVRPPLDAKTRARVAALRIGLAKTEARVFADQYSEARKMAESSVAEAQALGYAPVLAEAFYSRGLAELRTGEVRRAAATLLEAATTAENGRDDHQRAQALSLLAYVLGSRLARYAEAHADTALG